MTLPIATTSAEFGLERAEKHVIINFAQGMAGSSFQTNPFDLHKMLDDCRRGILQLPDFQRSWV
jgi:hypothetical protein